MATITFFFLQIGIYNPSKDTSYKNFTMTYYGLHVY